MSSPAERANKIVRQSGHEPSEVDAKRVAELNRVAEDRARDRAAQDAEPYPIYHPRRVTRE